jgi:hypothetical protein
MFLCRLFAKVRKKDEKNGKELTFGVKIKDLFCNFAE